ncbi:MAG: hypothetical protein WC069_04085 [Candidatus Shapirobacteria bacterium]
MGFRIGDQKAKIEELLGVVVGINESKSVRWVGRRAEILASSRILPTLGIDLNCPTVMREQPIREMGNDGAHANITLKLMGYKISGHDDVILGVTKRCDPGNLSETVQNIEIRKFGPGAFPSELFS